MPYIINSPVLQEKIDDDHDDVVVGGGGIQHQLFNFDDLMMYFFVYDKFTGRPCFIN